MRYTQTIATADTSDCTSTGWTISIAPSLIRFTGVSRWAGSTNRASYVYDNDGDVSRKWALARLSELESYLDDGAIEARRGASYRGFRCISSGHVVR